MNKGYDPITDWYMALEPEHLPKLPFELKSAHQVTGPLFFEKLKEEIRRGPEGARAMTGALEEDLIALKKIIDPLMRKLQREEDVKDDKRGRE